MTLEKVRQFIHEHRVEIILGIFVALFIANIPTIAHASGNTIIRDEIIKPKQIRLVERLSKPKIKKAATLSKIVIKPVKSTVKSVTRTNGGPNVYEHRSCTWWVKTWKPSVGNDWHNANTWDDGARADGWTVSSTPRVGAIAQTDAGDWGHVALVIGIKDGSVVIKEGNYDWNGSVRVTSVPISSYKYLY